MFLKLGAQAHALINSLTRPSPRKQAQQLYSRVSTLYRKVGLDSLDDRVALTREIAEEVVARIDPERDYLNVEWVADVARGLLDYEDMFALPHVDWSDQLSVSDYWNLSDTLRLQKALLDEFDRTVDLVTVTLCRSLTPIVDAAPNVDSGGDGITVPTRLEHSLCDIGDVTEAVMAAPFADDIERAELLPRLRERLEYNLIVASGGNPANPGAFNRAPRFPSKSDIGDPFELITAYLGGTPLHDLFTGAIDFTIPNRARFEHHHIIAGSGHGKTQTLQYLIAKDLEAVEKGERTVIVIDSQGDLIRKISELQIFAPGMPLHDRVVIIDPTDVEYPVSLNLFDVGLERLDQYSQLDRERLTNSILELYDFVLGSLLAAEMTQKQSVIFRYVTRLMLYIPDATIYTLRELMEPDSEIKFAAHINKLQGTARHFFETEFPSREFTQTRQQVLRRLWGILENQTFERMFSHPRSKLDLFSEMNEGKVILINTAKDLLKESGTEIFGRFFIALIAQAAQERATLAERERMPTFVYIDEAADYFDRNIGIILSQARKYNVGMVLAHQYLGQLEFKLQEAFAANTSIKFAGGVSAKDARALAPMLGCEPGLIESQGKGSFAAYVRGVTKSALPLKFPFGHMENMDRMGPDERHALQDTMRAKYAVHYKALGHFQNPVATDELGPTEDHDQTDDTATPDDNPDQVDTSATPKW